MDGVLGLVFGVWGLEEERKEGHLTVLMDWSMDQLGEDGLCTMGEGSYLYV